MLHSHSVTGLQSNHKHNPFREVLEKLSPTNIRRTNSGLVSRRASDITPKNIEWVWGGRIALGKVTLISGDPGLGKSQLTSYISARISTGGQWPNGEGDAPQGSVILLSAEDDDEDTIVPRLMAAGADLKRIEIVRAVRDDNEKGQHTFSLQRDIAELEAKAHEIGDVRLIVIDPISSYLGTKMDSHNNTQVRGALEPLVEMAGRLGISIVAITHSPKGQGNRAIHSFVGSIAFVGAARSGYIVTKDPNDEEARLLLPVKQNVAPGDQKGLVFKIEGSEVNGRDDEVIETSRVVWGGYTDIVADDALVALGTKDETQLDVAETFLKHALRDGPVPVKEMEARAKEEGISLRTLRRAKEQLKVRSVKRGLQENWVWELQSEIMH
jgi:putative DNA primase/helicase